MANEAVQAEAARYIKRFTCSRTAMPKGTLLTFSGPNEVKASSSTDVWAGISVEEITSADGITNVGVAIDGKWTLYAGGGTTISVGELVKLSGVNTVEGDVVEADIVAGKVIGKSCGAVTIGTAASIPVLVGVY